MQISDTEKFAGWHRQQHEDDSGMVSQVASTIGSLGGNVNLGVGGKYTQISSKVVAAQDVNIRVPCRWVEACGKDFQQLPWWNVMRSDEDVYLDVSSILTGISPPSADRLTMRARLAPESDVCDFEVDVIRKDGEVEWLSPDGKSLESLMKLIVELRNWYVSNGLTNGRPPWNACEFSLDVASQQLSVGFLYE